MKSGVIIIGLITIIPNICYSDENTLEFHCPERITIEQIVSASNNISGWSSNDTKETHNYVRTWLSTSPSDSSLLLRPDQEKVKKNKTIEQYNLEFYRKTGDSLYVVCQFTQSTVSISKPIPREYVDCEIAYERVAGLDIEKGVHCKKVKH
jgi:hypothetical protein